MGSQEWEWRDFPGSPVVRILPSNAEGESSIPGQGANPPLLPVHVVPDCAVRMPLLTPGALFVFHNGFEAFESSFNYILFFFPGINILLIF